MASIAQTHVTQQGGEGAPSTLSEHDSYRLVVRFGRDLLSDGFTALPNLLLDLYAELGITHCELVFLLHLLQFKWSKAEPYPSLTTIAQKMGLSIRAAQNHVHSLKSKAYSCPHTDEEDCSCPKYLVVTPRYRVGMGQTSNSYNLSGLFAAVLTLAREKGLLPAEDAAQKYTGPHAGTCMGGMKKAAPESDISNNTQSEPNEFLSNSSLGGKDEIRVSCSHEAMATRNAKEQPEEKMEKAKALTVSNQTPNTGQHTHPSSPTRADSSNRETHRLRGAARPRQSLSGKDEVKREGKTVGNGRDREQRELPRLPAPPLTKDEIDAKRKAGLNASGQTPLQAILDEMIPREHRAELTHQLGKIESPSQLRFLCKPMPVYPQLQQRIEEISLELNNFQVVTRNITQADNIRREAGVSLEELLDAIREAHRTTRVALQKGTITKKDETGRPISMPYFFSCLRQQLGLPPKPVCTQ